ncbi:hypothetical protein LUZ60_002467 [Juncus effusus]|nr:hypothetical protein LUZ60_002467 [Juncus effusus]
MAGVGALISSLLSSATKLLPEIKKSFFAPSSSLSAQSPKAIVVGDNLNKLIRTLKKIKATLRDAEEREMQDYSVKLWLKELKEVGREAEYFLDEYMYEIYRAKVEARDFSELNPRKRKQEEGSTVPDVFVDRIKEIRSRFDEIAKDGEALRLREEDGSRRDEGVSFRASSSRLIFEANVFGRKRDKEKVIELLFSSVNERMITVLPIVGKGGLGKTTLAHLVYNNREVNKFFDKFAWISVFEDFNVERLSQQLVESFTKTSCFQKSLSTLQDKIKEIVKRKRVFIVLDGVWNENQTLWESLYAPFISAAKVAFIVTTCSDRVANIMQTTSPFRLGL